MRPPAKKTRAAEAPRTISDFDRRLGARIRELRQAASMTLQAVADRLKLSMQQISRYETGFSTIDVPTFLGVARVIGFSAGAVLDEFQTKPAVVAARVAGTRKTLPANPDRVDRAKRQKQRKKP